MLRARSAAYLWFGLVALFSSCNSPQPTAETQSQSNVSGVPKKDEGWQHMKDCAEQTDRLAKRAGWIEGHRDGDVTVLGWQNHYSPKYDKCYVLVSYENHAATKDGSVPRLYDELYDAFEGRLMSMCTDARIQDPSAFCTINEPDNTQSGNCHACQLFWKEHMNN